MADRQPAQGPRVTNLKWIWDWHVEITIGLYGGIPVLWFKWTQRTPPPWR